MEQTTQSSQQRKPQQATAPDVPIDLGDAESVAARNKKLKSRQSRLDNGLKLVLGHPDSRLWLHSIIEESGPLNEAFTGNSATFFKCGQQAVGKHLMAILLEKHLDEYVLMCKEANDV